MASKFRKIDPRIWTDEKFSELDIEAAHLAFWILTSTRINRCGILLWSSGLASEETKIPKDRIDTVLGTIRESFRWPFDSSSKVLFIPNFFRYNQPPNPKALKGCLKDLDDVPNFDLKLFLNMTLRHIPLKLKNLYVEEIRNRIDTVSIVWQQEQEQENEQEQEKKYGTHAPCTVPNTIHGTDAELDILEAKPSANGHISQKAPESPISHSKAESPAMDRESGWQAILERANSDLARLGIENYDLVGDLAAAYFKFEYKDEFTRICKVHPNGMNQTSTQLVWRWLVRTPAIRDCVVRGHEHWMRSRAWAENPKFVQTLENWLKQMNFRVAPPGEKIYDHEELNKRIQREREAVSVRHPAKPIVMVDKPNGK